MRYLLAATAALGLAGFAPADVGRLKIVGPSDAILIVNDVQSRHQSGVRIIESQDLEPGVKYWYEVEARAFRGGQWVTERRVVSIRAGYQTTLSFTLVAPQVAKRNSSGAGNSSFQVVVPATRGNGNQVTTDRPPR